MNPSTNVTIATIWGCGSDDNGKSLVWICKTRHLLLTKAEQISLTLSLFICKYFPCTFVESIIGSYEHIKHIYYKLSSS